LFMTFQRLLSSPVPTEWAANSAKIVAEIGRFREMNFAHPTTQICEIVRGRAYRHTAMGACGRGV
jgi:hypothetical protein